MESSIPNLLGRVYARLVYLLPLPADPIGTRRLYANLPHVALEMMIASEPTSLSRLVRPDVKDGQQTGHSDLRTAGFGPGPAEVLVTASGLSLSPASTLCHHRSYIL